MGNSSESGAAAAQAAGALRTELLRDAAGRLIEKRTASHHCHYRYDAAGNLTHYTDPLGAATRYQGKLGSDSN